MKDRIVMILKKGEWETINFDKLKKCDTIKMFEPDGRMVKDNNGVSIFVIMKAPYKPEHCNISSIDVMPAFEVHENS